MGSCVSVCVSPCMLVTGLVWVVCMGRPLGRLIGDRFGTFCMLLLELCVAGIRILQNSLPLAQEFQ